MNVRGMRVPSRLVTILAALLAALAPSASAQSDTEFASGFETDAASGIAFARAQPDGAVSVAIPSAFVTFVKPAVGAEPAGFFIQGTSFGPALFVAVNPGSVTPAAQAGDRVSLTITAMATLAAQRRASAISGYVREATGLPLSDIVQDLSSASDVVIQLERYESELIAVSGMIDSAFTSAGGSFVAAPFSTPAVVGDPLLALRVPATVRDSADLSAGCTLVLNPIPMWRTDAQAQPTAYAVPDFASSDCPAPRVLSAQTTAPTAVRVTFDRQIAPGSVLANGSQFTFSGGIVASGASVSGRIVLVSTTSQTPGVAYVVAVAATVTDLDGQGVDSAADSAGFLGYQNVAVLKLTEVNGNISASRDLLELRAMSDGTLNGVTIIQDLDGAGGTVIATLPATSVVTGDRIVVHFAPTAGEVAETVSKTQCADVACYPGAWDLRGNATGMSYSNRTIAVRQPTDGAIQDSVCLARSDGAQTASYPAAAQFIQNTGGWLPSFCGGQPCSYTTNPTVVQISANWAGMSNTPTGVSLSRRFEADTNEGTNWEVAAQTWGAQNF